MPGQSYDTLKDLPRVPHAEGTARTAIQTGVGGNPPDKKYISYGEAVDIAVAASRLRARQKGEMEKIAGGLDDEDPKLYIKPEVSSPFAKMKVAQSKALSQKDVARLKAGTETPKPSPKAAPAPKASVGPIQSGPPAVGPAEQKDPGNLVFSYPGTPGQSTLDGRREGLLPSMGGPAGTVPPLEPHGPDEFSGPHGGSQLNGPKGEPGPDIPGPNVVYVDRPVEVQVPVPVETEASKWLKQRTRVQIATPETTFSVSAVAVVRSIHALTIIMPTANDAMTFIPRIGARIKVQSKETGVVDTVFTGASFDIPELGILGLAFLIPENREGSNDRES